ncbi:MAG: RidA family protein [Methanobacteriota archaeon]
MLLRRARIPASIEMKSVPEIPGATTMGPYSPCVVANGLVFVSMQAPLKVGGAPGEFAATDVAGQTTQCIRNIGSILEELGLGLDALVRTTVFLKDPKDFAAMNEAYRAFFPAAPPARSTAALGVASPGLLVAIDAVAVYEPRQEE